jgi:hypothetical protein
VNSYIPTKTEVQEMSWLTGESERKCYYWILPKKKEAYLRIKKEKAEARRARAEQKRLAKLLAEQEALA